MAAPRRDVAIYSPGSSVYFERGAGTDPHGGGAELQMAILARALAGAGLSTAVIVWPVEGGVGDTTPGLAVLERERHSGGSLGPAREAARVWRSLADANANSYVFRGSSPRLVIGAAFCAARRRRLVFSAANDLDFDFERPDRSGLSLRLYRAALRRADLVVVQSQGQLELAHAAGLEPVELIPSFAAEAEPAAQGPDGFLWIGRMVDYKRPLAFVRLARALPEVPFRMVCFPLDETTPELAAELERAAASTPNLELIGLLPRERVLELTSRAHAVVSTSAAEGMPNVFLEAWARGVPVASLDYDPDGIIERSSLGTVAGGSEERLAEQVASLAADEELRARLGANGRDYVLARHSPEAVSRLWAEALRRSAPGAIPRA
jgi:glycosyltransferase involved in cell wall biosynthesis